MSQQYERIMVAIDGSYESELAFIKGVHVAKRNNAQLLLVHVIDTRALQSVATFDSYIYEKLEDEAKAVLADFERLNTFERLLIGSSSEYILRHAKVDLLIVRDSEKTL